MKATILKGMTREIQRDYALAKKIDGFDGYMITPSGRVLSLPRKIKQFNSKSNKSFSQKRKELKELKPMSNGHHLRVELCKEGKRKTVFIKNLVAAAFVPLPEKIVKPTAIIKDGNLNNTHYTNIEWVSYTWACRGRIQNN
jgi:hypothetical protein